MPGNFRNPNSPCHGATDWPSRVMSLRVPKNALVPKSGWLQMFMVHHSSSNDPHYDFLSEGCVAQLPVLVLFSGVHW